MVFSRGLCRSRFCARCLPSTHVSLCANRREAPLSLVLSDPIDRKVTFKPGKVSLLSHHICVVVESFKRILVPFECVVSDQCTHACFLREMRERCAMCALCVP